MSISTLIDRMLPEYLGQIPEYFTRTPDSVDGILSDRFALWTLPVSTSNSPGSGIVVTASSDGIEVTTPNRDTVGLPAMEIVDLCFVSACLLASANRPVFGGWRTLPKGSGMLSELRGRFVLKRVALYNRETPLGLDSLVEDQTSNSIGLSTSVSPRGRRVSGTVSYTLPPCGEPDCEHCAELARSNRPVAVLDIDDRIVHLLIPVLLSAARWMKDNYPVSVI